MLNDIVTTQELAEYLNLTPERVQQLVKDGVLEPREQKRAKGKGYLFDAEIAVQSYVAYLQEIVAQRKRDDKDDARAASRKLRAEARYKEQQAEKMRLEVARLKNLLHEADVVAGYIGQLVSLGRAQIESVPKRAARLVLEAAGVVPTKKQELAGIRVLETELDLVLQTMSEFEYRPEELQSGTKIIDGTEEDDED